MLGPVLGHAFSVLCGMRGGKCIATIFGEMIALLWITPVGLILAALYIFFSVAVKINPHSRRSIVTFALFIPFALALEFALAQPAVGVGCAMVSGVSIFKHAVNRNETAGEAKEKREGREL
jgi:glycerol-3-phosphate acyltransferase PlsY